MKIEHLQKIIDRIQDQIHCPKCKARFLKSDIEIKAVKGNQVEFSSCCKSCDARAQISAEIGVTSEAPKIQAPVTPIAPRPTSTLKASDLNDIKQSVDGFKGKDVSDLFN